MSQLGPIYQNQSNVPIFVDTVEQLFDLIGVVRGNQVVSVRNIGAFAFYKPINDFVPVARHPSFSTFVHVTSIDAAELSPADPNDVLTGDLPTGWSIAKGGAGVAKLVNGVLQLLGGPGDTGLITLRYDLPVPLSDLDRTFIIARHSWTSDGGLADSSANNNLNCIEFSMNDKQVQWVASSAGEYSAQVSSGNILSASTVISAQPHTEMWESFEFEKGSGINRTSEMCRYWEVGNIAALGALSWPRKRSSWGSIAEPAHVLYRVGNGNVADPGIVQIDLRRLHIFSQGV